MDSLEQAAKTGDPDIGYALAMELKECSELDAHYEHLQNRANTDQEPSDALDAHADALDRKYDHCKGLPPEVTRNYVQWLQLAAERGSISAQITCPTIAGAVLSSGAQAFDSGSIEDYKSNSLRFLNAAANEGSIDAVRQLAGVYKDGILAPADPVMAYTYQFAIYQTGLVVSPTPDLRLRH